MTFHCLNECHTECGRFDIALWPFSMSPIQRSAFRSKDAAVHDTLKTTSTRATICPYVDCSSVWGVYVWLTSLVNLSTLTKAFTHYTSEVNFWLRRQSTKSTLHTARQLAAWHLANHRVTRTMTRKSHRQIGQSIDRIAPQCGHMSLCVCACVCPSNAGQLTWCPVSEANGKPMSSHRIGRMVTHMLKPRLLCILSWP